MNRRALYVLAQAAPAGVLEAATLPASAFDPLFERGAVVRAVKRAIARAEAALPGAARGAHGDRLLKLAFVLEHPGRPVGLDPLDAAAVDSAFAALSPPFAAPRKPRRPVTAAALVLVLGALATALAMLLWPTPEERFVKSALGRALASPLTDWVASLGRPAKADEGELARRQLLSRDVTEQSGPDARAALEQVLDRAAALERTRPAAGALTDQMKPLYESVNAFNAALEAERLPAMIRPYALDSSSGRSVWVISYVLRDKVEIEFAGHKTKAAHGRRLDNLNLDTSSEIYKDDLGDTYVVPTDEIEARFLSTILPAVVREVPLPFAKDAKSSSSLLTLSAKLTARLRDELFAKTKLRKGDAASLDSLVRQRDAAVARLKGKDLSVRADRGLALAPSAVRALERYARDPDIEELLRQNDHLAGLRPTVATATAPVARVVEEGFVAYRLEFARLRETPVKALEAREADEPTPRAWLSSRLAMLTRERDLDALALLEAFEPLVRWGTRSERTAAIVLFANLLPKLGLPGDAEWSSRDSVDQDTLATALVGLVEKPPAEVRAAAAKTYAEIFGAEPPAYRRTSLLRAP